MMLEMRRNEPSSTDHEEAWYWRLYRRLGRSFVGRSGVHLPDISAGEVSFR